MTAEIVNKIREVLQGYYPGEAYKLTGVLGTRFSNAMMGVFAKTDDRVVLEALESVCNGSDNLPSVPMIRKAVKEIANRIPDYVALPAPEQEPVNPDLIGDLLAAAKKRARERQEARTTRDIDPNDADYYQVPPELVAFARRKFPEISLKRIAENESEFSWNYRMGGMCDGHPMGLVPDPFSGLISNHIYIPSWELEKDKKKERE